MTAMAPEIDAGKPEPLVRSSYRAGRLYRHAIDRREASCR
jgi:hypothetical protein